MQKLNDYKSVPVVATLLKFFASQTNVDMAYEAYLKLREENKKLNDSGLIVFQFGFPSTSYLHTDATLQKEMILRYENSQKDIQVENKNSKHICSICGTSNYRIMGISSYGNIKGAPSGKTAGCKIISFNQEILGSYGYNNSNDNARICTHCSKSIHLAINHMLETGKLVEKELEAKKSKKKVIRFFDYSNRLSVSSKKSDTAILFWGVDNIDDLKYDYPRDDLKIEMTAITKAHKSIKVESPLATSDQQFYNVVISGIGARSALRSWGHLGYKQFAEHLSAWRQKSTIPINTADGKKEYRASIYSMVRCCLSKEEMDMHLSSRILLDLWNLFLGVNNDPTRIASLLTSRLLHNKLVETEEKSKVSFSMLSLLKLLVTTFYPIKDEGGKYMYSQLNEESREPAYLLGRAVSLMEDIQKSAMGKRDLMQRFVKPLTSSPAMVISRMLELTNYYVVKSRSADRTKGYDAKFRSIRDLVCGEIKDKKSLSPREKLLVWSGYHDQTEYSIKKGMEFNNNKKKENANEDK